MYQSTSSPANTDSIPTPSASTIHLHGLWLTLARVGWLAIAALSLLLAGIALPQYTAQLHTVCAGASCPGVEISPAALRTLQQAGLSLDGYAALTLTLTLLSALVWCAVGFFLFWRKSDDWCILIFSLQAVTQGSGGNGITAPLQAGDSFWWIPNTLLFYLSTLLILLVFALFPNGRFVPRWTCWVVLIFGIAAALPYIWADNPIISQLAAVLFFLPSVILLGGQIYRYRRVSTPTQRQQTKWIILGIAIILVVQIASVIPALVVPAFGQAGSLYQIVAGAIDTLTLLLIPPAIAISLLRYRLWDIDAIINKALVYGLLTALLAAVYAGLIIGLESLVGALSKQDTQPLVIVVSTLAIAALFSPVRRRIQMLIDHRFYRRKYDAEKTLAAFSAALRNEVDLHELHQHLLEVVQETMQPAQVSLWLRPLERRGEEPPHRLTPSEHRHSGPPHARQAKHLS